MLLLLQIGTYSSIQTINSACPEPTHATQKQIKACSETSRRKEGPKPGRGVGICLQQLARGTQLMKEECQRQRGKGKGGSTVPITVVGPTTTRTSHFSERPKNPSQRHHGTGRDQSVPNHLKARTPLQGPRHASKNKRAGGITHPREPYSGDTRQP